jgi:PKD repeat protein
MNKYKMMTITASFVQILICTIYSYAATAPTANFTANRTSGNVLLSVSFTDTSTGSPISWSWTFGDGGTSTLQNPSHQYTDAGIYTVALTATNSSGSNTKTITNYITVSAAQSGITTFFSEGFENSSYTGRGWYDGYGPGIDATTYRSGSSGTHSGKMHWAVGSSKPDDGSGHQIGAMRMKFTASDSMYVSLWVKFSSNFVGSQVSYQPHLFMTMTNAETSDYQGPAFTHTLLYIEENGGRPRLALGDPANINTSYGTPSVSSPNLCSTTENRAVNGGNGICDGEGTGFQLYPNGDGTYSNGRSFDASQIYFSDSIGSYYKGDWHHCEIFIQMNTVSGGKGNKTAYCNGTMMVSRS